MEVRYLGFEQRQNARSYRFDVVEKGERSKRFIVTADLSLFHAHGVGIQDGRIWSSLRCVQDCDGVVRHSQIPSEFLTGQN